MLLQDGTQSPNDSHQSKEEHARIRYRVGEIEMEVEGSPEFVEKHSTAFMKTMSNGASSHTSIPTSVVQRVEPEIARTVTPTPSASPADLITFFQSKAPQNQKEEVLVITYFYQHHLGRETLTLDDYSEAYSQLRRLGVSMPTNMKSSVRNVVDRTKFMFNPEAGKFSLTLIGEHEVSKLGVSRE